MPDNRKVSGSTCIRPGQRVQLTHNYGCGRWVWKFFKGPEHTDLTILPTKQNIAWPPGVAPDQNCNTQICCNEGSTHPPSKSLVGYTPHPEELQNSTAWYQLKNFPHTNVGAMYILYQIKNDGKDPKKCYRTKDLEPAAYRCMHMAPHNLTHIFYNDITYNLSLPLTDESRPKTFVWTARKEGVYCVGSCLHSNNSYTTPFNCTWESKNCFNLTTCGYKRPTQCPTLHPTPTHGLIKGSMNKTLLHNVNLVMAHISYNISNILTAYTTHCDTKGDTHTWLQSRIDDLVADYQTRLGAQVNSMRKKRDLLSQISGLFANSVVNTYRINGQSQYTSWLASQVATGFQHLTNSNERIIKAVRSEAQALLTTSLALFNQTHTIERDVACRAFAQDLFTAARQEILDLRLHKVPKHALQDLIEILDLHRWFESDKMKDVQYSELLTTLMMYTGKECPGCIGFFATFPLIHPDQVFPNSTTIHSIGVVANNQVLTWDHLAGYMTVGKTETLFTTRNCCHETTKYVICTCNTLQPFAFNDSKLINIRSLHGYSDAVQVSSTQWCVISEMNSFSYGGLTCPANHSFCLEVTEDFSMGALSILGRTPLDSDLSPWWEDNFYEEGTQALADTMTLVQQLIQQVDYHLNQAQVQANLAEKTAELLTSSTTHAAEAAYTWWDWIFRGCVLASAIILLLTLIQCCYFRHLIRSLKKDSEAALLVSKLLTPVTRQ
ncbi:uncharacterized protein LOC134467451 [Engraulis encrasicolus]|uniref:uncharacterized protein LOC134467451 n=1 Tax=Engraulis encrasicolus TaxID=184585 RepID=UPI002FD489DC